MTSREQMSFSDLRAALVVVAGGVLGGGCGVVTALSIIGDTLGPHGGMPILLAACGFCSMLGVLIALQLASRFSRTAAPPDEE